MEHKSVLLTESIDMLDVKPDGIYVDCTLGRGGHSSEILRRLKDGHLFAFDMDPSAIRESTPRLKEISENFTCIHAPFARLKEELECRGVTQVDGIMMDLGVSSPQFDDASRGFSYREDARLDMRMDTDQALSAWDIVNTYSQEELTKILKSYGEEPFAAKIAANIVKKRAEKPIDTTFELAEAVKEVLPAAVLRKKGHPAKRVFQAVRIEVNQELVQLQQVLQDGLQMLAPGGRMAVITFHSLEDRMVKDAFKKAAVPPKTNRRLPAVGEEKMGYRLLNRKPVVADSQELEENNRAHSAKLRGIERNGKEQEIYTVK